MESLIQQGITDVELLFQDEMRYGLISNYRRSWSKVGRRTELKNQQAYSNRYLFSAVAPRTGESFHLIGCGDANGVHTKIFLEELKKDYPNTHLVIVWDGAPFHKLKALREIDGITLVPLPAYSPQLNPTERLFGELRKTTANTIFATIDEQEQAIEKKIIHYFNHPDELQRLTGYDWILEQCKEVF